MLLEVSADDDSSVARLEPFEVIELERPFPLAIPRTKRITSNPEMPKPAVRFQDGGFGGEARRFAL